MTTNTTNTNTNTNTTSSSGGFGSKIKYVFNVVFHASSHYLRIPAEAPPKSFTASPFKSQLKGRLGENIRGTALGTADRVTSSPAGEKKYDDVAMKGRAEVAEGMACIKGHAPAPAGTAPVGQGTSAGSGTGAGTGTGAAVGGATAAQGAGTGVTGQGQQGGTSYEKTTGEKSGPEMTGSGSAKTSDEGRREAAVSTSSVHEQKQQDPGAVSQQEGKRDDFLRSGDPSQTRVQGTTDDRSQPAGEQQRVDEQRRAGQMGTGEGQGGQMQFQGISADEGAVQPSQQREEKQREGGQTHHEGVQQEGGQQGGLVGSGEGQGGKMQFQGISADEGGAQPSQEREVKQSEAGQIHHQEGGQQGSQVGTGEGYSRNAKILERRKIRKDHKQSTIFKADLEM
ncbi:hypothetical protein DFH29DRAFT_880285 [Suillus ampliporus]|nr:hypothetical protein DFH29DRAFT_880285 [Suillus ampliporus]